MTGTGLGAPTGTPPDRRPAVRWAVAVLALSVAGVLAVAAAMVPLALPADDDFLRAGRWGFGGPGLSWWRYVYHFLYLRWQGRWVSFGTEAAVLPAVDVTRHYPLLIGAVIAVQLACLGVACRWVTRGGPWRLTLGVTAAAAAVAWAGLPSLAEGVYWFTGAVENTTPVLLALALLATTAATPGAAGWFRLSGLALAATVAGGFHELYGGAAWLALAVGTVVGRRGNRRAWACALAGATVGLGVLLASPGNSRRLHQDTTSHSRHLDYDLRLAGKLLAHYCRTWALDPRLIAASFWVAVSPSLEAARVARPARRWMPMRWAVPCVGGASVAVGFVLPCYAFGNGPPDRTLSGDYLMFAATWLLTVYAWTRPLDRPPAPARYRRPGAAAAAMVALPLNGNVRPALVDLTRRARPWHAAVEARYAQLRRAALTHATLSVPPLPRVPRTLLGGELTGDPTDWRNFGEADYFGSGPLRVAATQPAGGRTR